MKIDNYPNWEKTNSYNKYDVVRYIDSLYVALANVTENTPIDDTSKWLLIFTNNTMVNHERFQMLLIEKASESGGGGGGVENYDLLSNRPQINGVTLTGNKTADDLSLVPVSALDSVNTTLAGKQNAGNYTTFADAFFTTSNITSGGNDKENMIQIEVDNKDAVNYFRQAITFQKDKILKYVYDGTNWVLTATYSADEDTGWITLIDGLQYRKKNGIVTVVCEMGAETIPNITLGQWYNFNNNNRLPTDCCPSRLITAQAFFRNAGNTEYINNNRVQINPNGVINMQSMVTIDSTTAGLLSFTVSYPV